MLAANVEGGRFRLRARMDIAALCIFLADGVTAAAGAFNAVWLTAFAADAAPSRRTASAALAIMNAGASAQATFAQAMFTAHRLGLDIDPFFEPGAWLGARLLLLAGTLLISMLILRRAAR